MCDHRIFSLDLLRGISIIGVILVHTSQVFSSGNAMLDTVESFGRFGVQVFFLVSAITIYREYRNNTSFNIYNFYVKRISRILPLWLIFLLIYSLVSNNLFTFDYFLTMFFLSGFSVEAINKIIPGGWSIVVEVSFYILFPYLLKFLKSSKDFIFAAIIMYFINLVILEPVLTSALTYFSEYKPTELRNYFYLYFFNQLPIFFLGISIYLDIINKVNIFTIKRLLLILSWVLISYTLVYFFALKDIQHGPLFLLVIIILYYIVFFVIKYYDQLNFNNKILLFIINVGKFTYPMYLIHFLLLDIIVNIYNIFALDTTMLYTNILFFIVVLFLSYYISKIIERYVDYYLRNSIRNYLIKKDH